MFFVLGLVLFCAIVRGDVTDPLPDASFWTELLSFLKNLKGVPLVLVVAAFVQLTLVFFRTSFGNFAGIYKLTIVTGLAVVYTLIQKLAAGAPLLDALLDGSTIAAVMVFIDQLRKHFGDQFVNPVGRS